MSDLAFGLTLTGVGMGLVFGLLALLWGALALLGRLDRWLPEEEREAADPVTVERDFVGEYREAFFNPYRAADLGQVDEVIAPHETRPRLIRALEVLRTKVQLNPARKHGLIPS